MTIDIVLQTITVVTPLIVFVYGYGKLTKEIEFLKKLRDEDIQAREQHFMEIRTELREIKNFLITKK